MTDSYYQSEWLVKPLDYQGWGTTGILLFLAETAERWQVAAALGRSCWKKREDGVMVLRFLWRVPSEEALQRVYTTAQDFMQFENTQAIVQEDFAGDQPVLLSNIVGTEDGANFGAYVEAIAKHNAAILGE